MSKQALTKKMIHICIIVTLIIGILFTAIIFVLKYDEKGEANMPFSISKISIISTADGQDVENPEQKWEKIVNQNNDIYIYVEKNVQYKKTETISSVKLENFRVEKNTNVGKIKFYKQCKDDKILYKNENEYSFESIEYNGAKVSNSKNLEISNQGGIIEFRCANNNIGTYKSNEDTEINYEELLKKINIKEEDLNANIYFDLIIKLGSGKSFKAENINISIPNSNLIDKGKVGKEINYPEGIIFKRIEN
ncbi:MAG: hypothetical protein J5507_04000 [Clostridia bacterium]|nr:hypothetical protein [Clostridia bacterium]